LRPWVSFWLRVGAAVAAMFVLAPVFGMVFSDEPFHRVMTRVLQVAVVVALLLGSGPVRAWPEKIRAMGLRGPHRCARFLAGASFGVFALVALLALSWALGGRTPVDDHRLPLWEHLGKAIAAGILVSLFEETLVRGYMKDVLGNVVSAFVFAAVHYFQPLPKVGAPKSAPAGEGYEPLLAFERAGDLFEAWTVPRNATLGVATLFLFAMALNRLRERTGTLYVGIGLHAGLVFVLGFYRRFLEGETPLSKWIYGGTRVHDGLLGLVAIGLLCLAAYRLPLPAGLKSDERA